MSARSDEHLPQPASAGAPLSQQSSAGSPDHELRHSLSAGHASRNPSASGSGVRKRASRAGTRSVSTLSPAQLERKRANDREAQRAIRQRTKEHIDKLEKRIVELSSNDERNTQLLAALKRNKELEEENSMLKANLQQANYALGVADSGNWQQVPHLKTPIPDQHHMRMSSQQDMRPSATSPVSAVTGRNDSASFPQSSGWQSAGAATYGASPMSARGFGNTGMRSAESAPDPNQQWSRYGRGRAQTTPLGDEYNKAVQAPMPQSHQQQQQPQSQQPQQMDYSYTMQGAHSHQAPHMRHLSEQLGLSPVDAAAYSHPHQRQQSMSQQSMMQQQQQQQQQQQPPRHQQPLPGMTAQSPSSYQPQQPGSLKASPSDPSPQQQSQMYYGPYSR